MSTEGFTRYSRIVTVGSPAADTGTMNDAIKTMINTGDNTPRMSFQDFGRDPILFSEKDTDFSGMKFPPGLYADILLLFVEYPKLLNLP
jgi:hypothetical protein